MDRPNPIDVPRGGTPPGISRAVAHRRDNNLRTPTYKSPIHFDVAYTTAKFLYGNPDHCGPLPPSSAGRPNRPQIARTDEWVPSNPTSIRAPALKRCCVCTGRAYAILYHPSRLLLRLTSWIWSCYRLRGSMGGSRNMSLCLQSYWPWYVVYSDPTQREC